MIPALPGSTTGVGTKCQWTFHYEKVKKIKRGCQEFTLWTAAHQNSIRKDRGKNRAENN